MTESKPVVLNQVIVDDSGVTERGIAYLHEDGTPMSQDDLIFGRWVEVTTHADPVGVKRFKRIVRDGPGDTA